MNIVLSLAIVAVLIFAGGMYLFSAAARGRSLVGRRTMRQLTKPGEKKTDAFEIAAEKLRGILRKLKLPHKFASKKFIIIIIGVLLALLCFAVRFYFGALSAIGLAAFGLMQNQKAQEKEEKERERVISHELTQFTRTLVLNLKTNRDLYTAIAGYRKIAGAELGREINILLAEMQAGNVQAALLHFEERIGTPEAFRLCGALRDMSMGIDQTATLTYIAKDMAQKEKQAIKKNLSLRPSKMRKTFIPAVGVCVAIIIYVLVSYVINNFQNLF